MALKFRRHPPRSGRLWQLWRIGRGRIVFTVIVCLLLTISAALNATLYAMPVLVAMGLAVLHTGALALTAVRPIAGAALSLVPIALIPLAAHPATDFPLPFTVAALITQVLVIVAAGLRARWSVATATWLLSMGIGLWVAYRNGIGAVQEGAVTNQVVFAAVSGGLLIAAIIARQWGQIRQQLVDERTISAEEQARRHVAEERARIARELHDVVAHGMSIVTVQATTARYRYPQIDDDVAAEFEEIAANSRRAMSELRGLLGALRNDEDDRELAPQPGLSDALELIAVAARAGNRVQGPDPEQLRADGVGELVSLSAYRIIQEALSNAIRHAPGSEVCVRVDRDERRLRLRITNGPAVQRWLRGAAKAPADTSRSGTAPAEGSSTVSGPGPRTGSARPAAVRPAGATSGAGTAASVTAALGAPGVGPIVFAPGASSPPTTTPGAADIVGTGHGLIGMRERATILGGVFIGGPLAGGGFSIDVTLPLTRPREGSR